VIDNINQNVFETESASSSFTFSMKYSSRST
jgi:hypothetical protein